MSEPPEIRPGEAAGRLADYRVVDVREPSEFEGPLGRVAGSENVPLGEVGSHLESFAGGPPLLVVCRSGNRSGRACLALAERGVAGATNLAGGMIEWNEHGLPVVRRALADVQSILETLAIWLSQVKRLSAQEARACVRGRLPDPAERAPSPAAARCAVDGVLDLLRAQGEPPADAVLVNRVLQSDLARLESGAEPS
ncbi:MAG: rhodanese-like domain-containing protein [Myxococcota bacterium]